jgi:hypothetical protein
MQAIRSRARTVFDRSNIGIEGSNLALDMHMSTFKCFAVQAESLGRADRPNITHGYNTKTPSYL